MDTEVLQFFNKNNAPPPLEIKTGDVHDLLIYIFEVAYRLKF